MRAKQAPAKDIEEYIAGFPSNVQKILQEIRLTIREAAPGAEEGRIVKFRVAKNLEFAKAKQKKR